MPRINCDNRRVVGFLLAIIWPSIGSAQVALPEWSEVEITTRDLGSGIYVLEGFGGNIGVLAGADGVILVDDQYAPLTQKIRAAIGRITDQPVRFVINTHWHPDHTGGNDNLGRSGALIMSHDRTRTYLDSARFDNELPELLRPGAAGLPVLTFNDSLTFHINGQTVRALHIPPAHTDGDVIIQFVEADVFHVGDTFFSGFYPFIDVSHGGSINGMIAFYDRLEHMAGPETRIIGGHGPVAGIDDVRRYRADLITIRDRVAAAIRSGLSLDQLIAKSPLADLDPIYAGDVVGQADVLRMVYQDLSASGDTAR